MEQERQKKGDECRRFPWPCPVIDKVKRMDSNIQVRLPAEEQVIEDVEFIGLKYSLLGEERVFATMDGLKFYLKQSGCHAIQNTFYNGWKHDHYISSIFLFMPDGMVWVMVINVPGLTHDSTSAEFGFIYDKLQTLHDNCK
eukprot:7948320-Ditylum_brightwellii.AAC.2